MNKKLRTMVIVAGMSSLFFLSSFVQAQILPEKAVQAVSGGYTNFEGSTLEETRSFPIMLAQLVQISLGFVGIVSVVMLVYAGFQYMTSGGDGEVIQGAVKTIKNAVIGMAIVLISYSLTLFVMGRMFRAMVTSQVNRGGNPCLNGKLSVKGFWKPGSDAFKNACNDALKK
jgi:cytochrome bd-type quinol oxidase subunit 2